MRIFKEYGADPLALLGKADAKSQTLESLSHTQAIMLLTLPAKRVKSLSLGMKQLRK